MSVIVAASVALVLGGCSDPNGDEPHHDRVRHIDGPANVDVDADIVAAGVAVDSRPDASTSGRFDRAEDWPARSPSTPDSDGRLTARWRR